MLGSISSRFAPLESLPYANHVFLTDVLGGSTVVASSRYRQRAFASCIWRGLRQSGSNKLGLPTTITVDIAREVATLNRFRLYRNSIPRGASSGEDVVSE